ncbi:TPA: hypothetical protein EYP13_03700, partial [Candidatus Micrarchaeota archaeon]|nr:hypothetical protein [Candidatus Micrarchaeota archaeon]
MGVVPLARAAMAQSRFYVAGLVKDVSTTTTKNGDRMAFLVLEDKTGEVEVVVFPKLFEEYPGWFVKGNLLILKVRWGKRNGNGGRSLVAEEVKLLGGGVEEPLVDRVVVEVPLDIVDEGVLKRLA